MSSMREPPPPPPALRRPRLSSARRLNRHVRALRKMLNVLLILALLYTLALVKTLLIPLVLAAFIALALNPIVAAATRVRVPRALAAAVIMLVLAGALGTAVSLLAGPAANWLHHAPRALRHMAPKLRPVTDQLNAATRATQSLIGGHAGPRDSTHVAISAWDVLQTTPLVLANVLTVALLVFFFLVYGELLLRRLVEVSPTFEQKRHSVSIVRSIQIEVSRYLLTTTVINTCLGAITAGWLWWRGVPDPLLWGGVATLANFIPYVGAITTTLLLAAIGLLHFSHTWDGLLPALGFACLTSIEGNLVTPMILGHSMRLSPVAILVWLLLWGYLWGIPGALLAVPMLTSTKLVAERLRGWEWFAHMVQR